MEIAETSLLLKFLKNTTEIKTVTNILQNLNTASSFPVTSLKKVDEAVRYFQKLDTILKDMAINKSRRLLQLRVVQIIEERYIRRRRRDIRFREDGKSGEILNHD